ncbi:MAG: energy transducer TonB [Pseudomonadota bacterium]
MYLRLSKFVMLGLAVSSASLIPKAAYAKKEPVVLTPDGQWVARFDDEICSLHRKFGEGKESALLVMRRYSPSTRFWMTLAGQPFRTRYHSKPAKLRFRPEDEYLEIEFFRGKTGDDPALVFRGSTTGLPYSEETLDEMPDEEIRALQYAFRSIEIGYPLKTPLILDTGPMGKALKIMERCTDELVSSWGLDAEKHKNLQREVTPLVDLSKWIRSSDYPTDMLNSRQPAIVSARLMIDREGQLTGCHIQRTTRPKEFDDAVCGSIKKRARFEPAIDASGEAIDSYYRIDIRFQIPG